MGDHEHRPLSQLAGAARRRVAVHRGPEPVHRQGGRPCNHPAPSECLSRLAPAVRYRQMGHSGLTVSVLGLGCNNFGLTCSAQESRVLVDAALDAGITLFDTAQAYGNPRGSSEAFLGEALHGRRHAAILSTKVGSFSLRMPDVAPASRRGMRAALETSLRRLQTDYVDLLYLHQPDDS